MAEAEGSSRDAGLLRLNLGCGGQRPFGWVNCDSSLASLAQSLPVLAAWARRRAAVSYVRPARYVDLRWRWPFADRSAAVVYASHVFEHLRPSQARHFLTESQRVLVARGVLRLVVPDLEQIARQYVQALEPNDPAPAQALLYALNLDREQAYPGDLPWPKRLLAWWQDYPHQHKAMFDQALLAARVRAAGFTELHWCGYGQSALIDDIEALECTAEGVPSLYLECLHRP